MIDQIKKIFKKNYQSINRIEIDTKKLCSNFEYLQSLQKDAILFPVLKSNAYGHGLQGIAKMINKLNTPMVAIDSFVEYQYIKKYSHKKVLVLSEMFKENYRFFDFHISSFCIYNFSTLQYFCQLKKKIKIHLFLNTWMNREGVDEKDLREILELLKNNSKITLEWVCSHLAGADESDGKSMEAQIQKFKNLYEKIKEAWFSPQYRHIGASAGLLKIRDNFFNAYRPWIAFYWYNPLEKDDKFYAFGEKLQPVLSVYSHIVSIHKNLFIWEKVGYNGTFLLEKKSNIASIPFGYFEGLDRRLSNNGFVKYKWTYISYVGRISMNISSFDFWEREVFVWDEIEIISTNKEDKNSIENIAKNIGTISYEILVRFQTQIKRVYK